MEQSKLNTGSATATVELKKSNSIAITIAFHLTCAGCKQSLDNGNLDFIDSKTGIAVLVPPCKTCTQISAHKKP